MGFRSVPKLTVDDELRGFARVVVRAGTYSAERIHAEVVEAVRQAGEAEVEHRASTLIGEARADLVADQQAWPEVTDYDRLQRVFAALETAGLPVLQAIEDHWTAKAELDRRAQDAAPSRGIVWFTAPDVWHAVDHGMLELNVWHPDSANVAEGDGILDEVIAALAAEALDGHFDEGRIEVSAHWHRRLGA
ncbi:DUF6891 domain-containing protein [Solicola gregarius]|uniref:DUF6891 domain-containing protein n=1 Tax=Solicola gregarius TaxID=2908642 RepID=A0AA46TGF2_9ACTN|nr:hypothetical protein [Solicola gregarius]UYM04795.1 hypothetical protein L0C25_20025 [Solicola gregarius]